MIWLNTLGSAVLYDDQMEPLGGAARHRRTLGLLSVLVVAGEAGLTRDKLIGIFWPDFDSKRARHSLTQALYAARKATGHDDLFDAGEDVRLNFALVGSDVREFEQRLQTGDDEEAVALYRGPFLDGFYLQAPEFDIWQAQQCARFEDSAVAALARVVSRAEAQGDVAKAIEHARRLSSIRPTDAAAVVNLMRLLANSGDRPAAIQQAQLYATRILEQYDMAPDSAVIEYVEELRAAPQSVIHPEARSNGLAAMATSDGAAHDTASLTESRDLTAQRGRRRNTARFLLWGVISSLTLVSIAALIVSRSDQSAAPLPPLEQQLLIAPFRVSATQPELSYLSEGMIELLATRLADDSAARAMDGGATIRAWRSAGVSGETEVSVDTVAAIARKLGAERVLIGSVIGTPQRIILDASIVSVPSEEITTRATVEGSADTLAALVDNLARKLLLQQADPYEPLSERMTYSLPALRAYMRGTGAYARGDYALAQQFYDRALRLDTTFATAALKLALAASRMADFETQRVALDHAWRMQQLLSDKDRTFLAASLGPKYPALSTHGEIVAAWNRAARLASERPEVWAGLGLAVFERQMAAGLTGSESAIAALARALKLDPAFVPAHLLLARLDSSSRPAAAALGAAIATQSAAPFLAWWRGRLKPARPPVLTGDSFARIGPANLRSIALASTHGHSRRSDGDSAVQLLLSRAASADEAMSLLTAQHSMALIQGQPERALDVTQRMQRTRPAGRVHHRLRVLDVLYSNGDSAAAVAAARRLETAPGVPGAAADMCVGAQWHVARGELAEARAILNVLRNEGAETPLIAGVQPASCVPFLDAAISVAARSPDAAARVEMLDSLALTTIGAGDLAAYGNIALAEMHRSLNAPAKALAAIRRRPYGTVVWPRYLATAQRIEDELCASAALADQCSSH